MSNQMNIQDLLRAESVKRWTIVHTTKNQSLAEHTFNVTMIARAICKKLRVDDYNVMKAAMAHDLDEIRTGDIPTPFKKAAKDQGVDLNDIYERVTDRQLGGLEQSIVKSADRLEALWFVTNFGSGRHAEIVKDSLYKAWKEWLNELEEMNPGLALVLEDTYKDVIVRSPEI